ncbi:MAG TPA: hypothetical protein VLC98_12740 [Phnomibacter sp.]|nr:hypothetical protein [Phnomibacter sp.]
MRAFIKAALLMPALFVVCLYSHSQPDTLTAKLRRQAEGLNGAAQAEAQRMSDKMEEQTARLQQKMAKYERKLSKVFQQSDSLQQLAQQYMAKADPEYWLHKLQANDSLLATLGTGPYLQRLDSLKGMLKFLDQDINNIPALQSLAAMKARLGVTQEYQQMLDEKMSYWKQMLSVKGLTDKYLPASFKKLQTEVLAYKSQVAQWKETLNDPAKMETEMLKLLNKLPAFQKFMQQNGELARLFGGGVGASGTSGVPIPGLQTTQSVMSQLQQRMGGGPQAQQFLQQQIQQGMDQLSQQQQMMDPLAQIKEQAAGLVDKVMQGGALGNTAITPAQQEKAQLKSKSFGQRLEFGWNLQNAMHKQDFPAIRDVGISLGYKLNPRSVVGVGVAYKFALGESWKHIEWTHEGVGLRSFLDWRIAKAGSKLLKGFWITGGFEMNYWQRIDNNAQWKNLAWKQSGLVGLTKTVKTGKKTMKMQLLWDFLSYNTNSTPVVFRVGYSW